MPVLDSWKAVLGEAGEPAPEVDWAAVESDLGTALPTDYRVLVDNYRVLNIGDFLSVFRPVGGEDEFSLREFADQTLTNFRGLREDLPSDFPHPLYPEPGGLLPWGVTDNNDFLCWLVQGEPDQWPVVVTDVGNWWTHHGNMQSFLVGVLTGDVRCPIFPDDFPDENYVQS
ncbi:SMI1/KNR4 family protein [Lentzea alba]|uniref:SMI1/KNR4 family protein n=1 Tax=Lentzea alba TaxID=2714351 RepID=UPI0039BF081E